MDIKQEILSLKDELIGLRRDFHMYPETRFDLPRTSKKVADYLRNLGLEVKEGVGKSGVVGLLRGNENGKTVMLRADMDALPIDEANDVPYKSRVKGKMHACGHDGHTAMLLVAAKVLSEHKDQIKGNVKFVFQPSEEYPPGGAKPMIEDGVMENPHVDGAFGIHLWTPLKTGTIGTRPGALMAAADKFDLKFTGKGGHGAYPHLSVDPIVAASQFVTSVQSIVSREVSPLDSAVITVGKFSSGDVFNVIPENAVLFGTVRTLKEETRSKVRKRIEEIARGIGAAFRVKCEFNYENGYPVLINDESMVELVRKAGKETVGAGNVLEVEPSMGGEDMAYYLQKAKGAFYFVGASNEKKGITAPHHSPYFDIDEDALPIGVEMPVRTVLFFFS